MNWQIANFLFRMILNFICNLLIFRRVKIIFNICKNMVLKIENI